MSIGMGIWLHGCVGLDLSKDIYSHARVQLGGKTQVQASASTLKHYMGREAILNIETSLM